MAETAFLDVAALRSAWRGPPLPLAVVDLDAADGGGPLAALPPFPLIGIGRRGTPLAAQMDVVVEPPVSLAALTRTVLRNPQAATVAVQVLRLVERLDEDSALVAESLSYGLLQGSTEHRAWLRRRPDTPPGARGMLQVTRDVGLLRLKLDRPDALNAIDTTLRDQLREAFELAAIDPDIDRVVLAARGRAFSVGADLSEFGTTRDPARAHAIRRATLPAPAIARAAARLEVHVQGACIGAGLELAAFARRIVADRRAWFQLPELAMGLIPGAGGCVSLTRRIGRQRAALMILSGRRIDAATALRWGLVDAVVDEFPGDPGGADVLGAEA